MNAPKTSSGLTSTKMGSLLFPFPTVIYFCGDSPISGYLVSADKWSTPSVYIYLNVIFGSDESATCEYITLWRKYTLSEYIRCFEEMRCAE